MKIGDVVNNAIWLTGEETEGLRMRYMYDVSDTIDELCQTEGFIHGEVVFIEKCPGDERVPKVPDHIQGPKVRLLIAEATVLKEIPKSNEGSFVDNLDRKDLIKLRKLTKQSAFKFYNRLISNEECDEIIEALGPDSAVETMRTIH